MLKKNIKFTNDKDEVLFYLKNGFLYTDVYLKNILKTVGKEVEDIFILRGASGETYLLLHALEHIMKQVGTRKPAIIATAGYHVDLCRLYCPDIPCYFLPIWKIGFEKNWQINRYGKRFFILFPFNHYINWEEDLAAGKALHYYENLLIPFNTRIEDVPFKKTKINLMDEFSVLEKAEKINLNLDNFIFICPEARSNPSLSEEFWKNLDVELRKLGYDTFFNYHDTKNVNNLKTVDLSVFECNVLARYAKGIIGIKSGLIEPLLSIPNVPCISIFTSMYSRFYDVLKPMPVKNHMKGCSTMLLPGDKSLRYEYDGENMTEQDLLQEILSKFKPVYSKPTDKNYYINKLSDYIDNIKKHCKAGCYNFIAHKHLGDIFYQIQALLLFSKKNDVDVHVLIQKKYEFLVNMLGLKNYSIIDELPLLDARFLFDFHKIYPTLNLNMDSLTNIVNKYLFSMFPIKNYPFVLECDFPDFIAYNNYWCFRWAAYLNMVNPAKYVIPNKTLSLSDEAKYIVNKIAPINKIVLFAPEAATAIEFAPEFWNIIAEQVHKKGYTIIVNSKKYKINHGISAFDLGLSLQDVVALGLNCAYVFSLRSGLCDVLVGAGERLYAFYPAQLRREYKSLETPFDEKTNVNEIQIYNWKIDHVVWENIDLTKNLQNYINGMHRNYYKEKIKRIFSKKSNKQGHRFLQHLFNDLAGMSKVFPENNIQNPKPNFYKNVSVLGFSIYKHFVINANPKKDRKIYLGGLLHRTKYLNDGARITRFLGIPVYQRKYTKYKIVKILGIPVYIKDRTKEFLQSLCSKIQCDYDDIYISRHNIGETYVYLSHIKDWINYNKSKKPVVVVWRKKDIPFYEMFVKNYADVVYVPIEQYDLNLFLTQDVTSFENHRIFCHTLEIAENMKKIYDSGKEINFYDFIVKDFKSYLTSPEIPKISKEKKVRVSELLKNNLISKKFVFVCPAATSLVHLGDDFWALLIEKLKDMGYEVIVNSFDETINMKGVLNIKPDIEEMFILAVMSSGFISLASGLAVLLSTSGVKADLIYTDFKNNILNSSEVLNLYSVKNLPAVDKQFVKEYDVKNYSEKDLIEKICKRYE